MSAAAAISLPFESFQLDQHRVNKYLNQSFALRVEDEESSVEQAVRYAVFGKAQRIRPILALRVGRMLKAPEGVTMRTAVAVELVHCASLILDDLPCMDNSPTRRGRPSVHVKFGEAAAILAAFTLVTRAVSSVAEMTQFQGELMGSLNCAGLIAGQALDLHLSGRAPSRRTLAELKTVPLFTLAISAGLVGARVKAVARKRLSTFGREFGLAFQIADDWQDGESINTCAFQERIAEMRHINTELGEDGHELEGMIDYLSTRGPRAGA